MLFKKLRDDELVKYVKWARDNYTPGQEVDPLWHPAVRVECERMNLEVVQSQED